MCVFCHIFLFFFRNEFLFFCFFKNEGGQEEEKICIYDVEKKKEMKR